MPNFVIVSLIRQPCLLRKKYSDIPSTTEHLFWLLLTFIWWISPFHRDIVAAVPLALIIIRIGNKTLPDRNLLKHSQAGLFYQKNRKTSNSSRNCINGNLACTFPTRNQCLNRESFLVASKKGYNLHRILASKLMFAG